MITDGAKTMLFEAACFDGVNIRKSSKRVGLRTDASGKFEKGLDPNNAMAALNRACQLVEELGAGEVVGGAIDVYSKKKEPVRVPFDAEKINRMLGTNISEEEMLGYFKKIDLDWTDMLWRYRGDSHGFVLFAGLPPGGQGGHGADPEPSRAR